MYPVTDNKDNQGGTRLVPASLISKDKDSKVGSTTLSPADSVAPAGPRVCRKIKKTS